MTYKEDDMVIKLLKNTILILIVILLAGPFGWAKEKKVESQLTLVPLTIDGAGTEWQPDELIVQEKPSVSYAFKNDGKNLYIYFVFNDREAQSSVMSTGMKVWMNFEGKDKKKCGYHFIQRQISADEMIEQIEKKGSKLTEKRKEEIRKNPSYIFYQSDVINKKEKKLTEEAIIGEVVPPLFKARPTQKRTMAYEMRIPLNGLIHVEDGGELVPGENVMIGFEWGGMTPEIRKQIMARRAAGGSRARASGMSSDPTRESGGRANTTEMTERSRSPLAGAPKEHSFWLDLKLSAEK